MPRFALKRGHPELNYHNKTILSFGVVVAGMLL
jgi:hypothetical protein